MNWLDQHDALDQLSATISEAVESWLDRQLAEAGADADANTDADANADAASETTDYAAPTAALALPSSARASAAAKVSPPPQGAPDAVSALAAARLASGRGYFWKALFLPEGTRLRVFMRGGGQAEVIGNQLLYDGLPTSPNQFLRLFRGIPRNAWEELCIRFPGEKHWRRAKELRRALGIPRRRGSIPP
ncbi:hypothetical protein MJ904_04115 [Massilia sp. MB5]|uniref:hypothetical protein n=1 Tax=Massilia sp. MB5 TaxID=2919578 RepID=UPI001F0D84F9|nr:hypothetical protein [Massilia sp. MB5]UMR31428.1 hypothetical protein MJ904_04115 [Massilia sp. MB5]